MRPDCAAHTGIALMVMTADTTPLAHATRTTVDSDDRDQHWVQGLSLPLAEEWRGRLPVGRDASTSGAHTPCTSGRTSQLPSMHTMQSKSSCRCPASFAWVREPAPGGDFTKVW